MSDEQRAEGGEWTLSQQLENGRRRREAPCREGAAAGARRLLERRDPWDADSSTSGAYFVACADAAAAAEAVREHHTQTTRVVAVYDLRRPLAEPGPGGTWKEWLRRETPGDPRPSSQG